MASTCISSCINDTHIPLRRPTYVNLHKWPDSDAEFVRSVSSNVRRGSPAHPRIVDSISCRQMYLRSYTFSRRETVPEKTKKCLGRIKERVARRRKRKGISLRKKCVVLRRAKELTFTALFSMFRRLLLCTAKVDVADHRDL